MVKSPMVILEAESIEARRDLIDKDNFTPKQWFFSQFPDHIKVSAVMFKKYNNIFYTNEN